MLASRLNMSVKQILLTIFAVLVNSESNNAIRSSARIAALTRLGAVGFDQDPASDD